MLWDGGEPGIIWAVAYALACVVKPILHWAVRHAR